MDAIELLCIGLEAFLAGICWTFGGMVAEAIYDRVFPPPDDDVEPPSAKPAPKPPAKRRKPKYFSVLPLLFLILQGGTSTGCSTVVHEGKMVPGYATEIICRLPDCRRWTPAKVQRALDMWVVETGDLLDVSPQIPSLIIVEDTGDLGPAGVVTATAGKTLDPFTIQIAGRYYIGQDYRPMGKSAFSHELCHVMLWSDPGDPDRNHAEAPGPWTEQHDEMLADFDSQLLKVFG
jgi:hypothetical protein